MPRHPLLVVTGLAAEARILQGEGVVCACAPPAFLPERIETALAGRTPGAVVSFGLCGGLAPALRPGALVIPERVAEEDGESWRCDDTLRIRLETLLRDAPFALHRGTLLACDAPVIAARDKAALHEDTGAVAVDTESQVAARAAARFGVPFTVLRAVCDDAARDLPPLATRAIGADGRLDWTAIGAEIGRRPGQLALLPGTALATLRAMRTLRRVRMLCGAGLGLAGVGVGG